MSELERLRAENKRLRSLAWTAKELCENFEIFWKSKPGATRGQAKIDLLKELRAKVAALGLLDKPKEDGPWADSSSSSPAR